MALDTTPLTTDPPQACQNWRHEREICNACAPGPVCLPNAIYSSQNDAGAHEIRARTMRCRWSVLIGSI